MLSSSFEKGKFRLYLVHLMFGNTNLVRLIRTWDIILKSVITVKSSNVLEMSLGVQNDIHCFQAYLPHKQLFNITHLENAILAYVLSIL